MDNIQLKRVYIKNTCLVLVLLLFASCNGVSRNVFDLNGDSHPWTNLDFKNDSDNFQFVIMADRTGSPRHGIFEGAVDKINLMQPEFVVSIGDLIDGYTYDMGELNWQWDEFESITSKFEMPFFAVPGNHDIADEGSLNLWKERFGRDYYYFVYKDVLFLCMNSEDPGPSGYGHVSDEQVEFFKEVLAKHTDVRWTFVFMHKPLWPAYQRDNNTNFEEIAEILNARNHTMFGGHHHNYYKHTVDGTSNYTLSTTGALSTMTGAKDGKFDHIVWLTVMDEGPVIANIALEGIYDDDPRTYVSYPLQNEAIRDWLLLGTFPNTEGTGFDTDYIGEQNVRPIDGQSVESKQWQICSAVDNGTAVDLLGQSLEPKDNVVAYVHAYIWSPKEQKAVLRIGSDDGCKIWLNGEEVINTGTVARFYRDDSERAEVNLQKGVNSLLVKIAQGSGGWMFSVKIPGKEKLGLKYSVTPDFPKNK